MRARRVLDIGGGLGDNSIFLAEKGFSVTCLNIAHLAIKKGKSKAKEKNVEVDFRVGDALKLSEYFDKEYFDVAIDSGLFHTLEDGERPLFAKQIRRVLVKDGSYFMLCFSENEPGSEGPRRISRNEIEKTFSGIFRIDYIRDAFSPRNWAEKGAQAYMESMTKTSA